MNFWTRNQIINFSSIFQTLPTNPHNCHFLFLIDCPQPKYFIHSKIADWSRSKDHVFYSPLLLLLTSSFLDSSNYHTYSSLTQRTPHKQCWSITRFIFSIYFNIVTKTTPFPPKLLKTSPRLLLTLSLAIFLSLSH